MAQGALPRSRSSVLLQLLLLLALALLVLLPLLWLVAPQVVRLAAWLRPSSRSSRVT